MPKSARHSSFCRPWRLLRAALTDLLGPAECAQLSVGRSTSTFTELGGSPHLLALKESTFSAKCLMWSAEGKKNSSPCEFVYVKTCGSRNAKSLGVYHLYPPVGHGQRTSRQGTHGHDMANELLVEYSLQWADQFYFVKGLKCQFSKIPSFLHDQPRIDGHPADTELYRPNG